MPRFCHPVTIQGRLGPVQERADCPGAAEVWSGDGDCSRAAADCSVATWDSSVAAGDWSGAATALTPITRTGAGDRLPGRQNSPNRNCSSFGFHKVSIFIKKNVFSVFVFISRPRH
jgi:hypothetical protein